MDIKKEKSDLVQSDIYQKIRKYQIERIISLSSSNIEPLELKGMLKLINSTDSWKDSKEKETL